MKSSSLISAFDLPRPTHGVVRAERRCKDVPKLLKAAAEVESADNFQVYADPAGHPFCLCWVING
jgi:hypothetical protein